MSKKKKKKERIKFALEVDICFFGKVNTQEKNTLANMILQTRHICARNSLSLSLQWI